MDNLETRPDNPHIVTLQAMLQRLEAGEMTAEAFYERFQLFDQQLKRLESMEPEGTRRGDPGVTEAMMATGILVMNYRQGYEWIVESLEDGDLEKRTAGFKAIQAADKELALLFEEIRKRHEEHTRQMEEASVVTCPRCGTKHRRGVYQCTQCRFMLPQLVEDRQETDITDGGDSGFDPESIIGPMRSAAENGQLEPLTEQIKGLLGHYQGGVRQSSGLLERGRKQMMAEVAEMMEGLQEVYGELADVAEAVLASLQDGSTDQLEPLWERWANALVELAELRDALGRSADELAMMAEEGAS